MDPLPDSGVAEPGESSPTCDSQITNHLRGTSRPGDFTDLGHDHHLFAFGSLYPIGLVGRYQSIRGVNLERARD